MKITRGCNIPITGTITSTDICTKKVGTVAIYGPDYEGMKPSMKVKEGDKVAKGEILFSCKKTEGVNFTAPVAGTIQTINRGARRAFQSIVIKVDESGEIKKFECKELSKESVTKLLLESGEWCGLRTRPYSKVADPIMTPSSIFVTAIDSNPLAIDPFCVIDKNREDFEKGLEALSKIAKLNLCISDDKNYQSDFVETSSFSGVHPAGNVGTHVHFIDPVYEGKMVWHIGYQNVIAIGKLIFSGEIWNERYVALVGPEVKDPKIFLTLKGADLSNLTEGELKDGQKRIISGSVLNGHEATEASAYLGNYHNQVTVLEDGGDREFLGWALPGANKYSLGRSFLASFVGQKKYKMNTLLNGGHRAIVTTGAFEKVMPLELLATPLIKAIASKDIDQALRLGCLELDEEDLALCTFACNGKNDYGVMLRECLTMIEREG